MTLKKRRGKKKVSFIVMKRHFETVFIKTRIDEYNEHNVCAQDFEKASSQLPSPQIILQLSD